MRPAPRAPRWSALVLAAVAWLAGAGGATAAEGDAAVAEAFDRFQQAFESRSAATLIECMAPEGTLSISLLGFASKPDPMKREQALKVLKSYFAQVSSAALKPKEGQAADALVRTYDYARRLKKNDPATTRLTVTLKKDAAGGLRLSALVESAK